MGRTRKESGHASRDGSRWPPRGGSVWVTPPGSVWATPSGSASPTPVAHYRVAADTVRIGLLLGEAVGVDDHLAVLTLADVRAEAERLLDTPERVAGP